jgi:DNA topoisomerase-1
MYSERILIDPKTISKWLRSGFFSRSAKEVLNVFDTSYSNSFIEYEKDALAIIRERAKFHPEYTMREILQEIRPVYNRQLSTEQTPIFHELWEESEKLPAMKVGDVYTKEDIEKKQHFTEPPARFTEASLIKEMESLGIGRPSTYATIVTTIKDREYVTLDKKKFVPTNLGFETNDKLQEYFSGIINVKYTATMEEDLDKIAEGKEDNIKTLRNFYDKFEPILDKAFQGMEKKKAEETGETCPNCGSPLVKRNGRFGEFVACSNYPTCKYIKKEEKEVKAIIDCPICKKGKIVERLTKKGTVFYGCNNYPKCKVATWDIPTGEICPKCKSLLVTKDNKVICSNKDCDYEK